MSILELRIRFKAYEKDIIIEPISPAIVPFIVTPPLVPFGTIFFIFVISLGGFFALIPISVIHVSALCVAIVANAANISGEVIKPEKLLFFSINEKKSWNRNNIPKNKAGKLLDKT